MGLVRNSIAIPVSLLLRDSLVHFLPAGHVRRLLFSADLADEFFGAGRTGGDGAFERFGVAGKKKEKLVSHPLLRWKRRVSPDRSVGILELGRFGCDGLDIEYMQSHGDRNPKGKIREVHPRANPKSGRFSIFRPTIRMGY